MGEVVNFYRKTETNSPRAPQSPLSYGTQTTSFSPEDILGGVQGQRQKSDLNELWREYAVYEQQVRSISRTSAVFYSCLQAWKEDVKFSSSLTDIIMHPLYQRIIGLGPDVVPFILRELADNGGHWFWALQALTGENPVPEEDQGRPRKMVEAWLNWGQDQQLV